MKVRAIFFILAFIIMTILASFMWVLFIDLILPLKGRLIPFLVSLPMVLLGGYVAGYCSPCLGLDGEESLTVGILVSVVAFIAMSFFFL
ncbi:hypothetical protein TON_1402 [Thermococcus onnurineus NA1]|uniref:Uncharacterized protein n=1 Tax=Thermococcus onnurineus (strain NA1) TaxID=523850 RepID=B6YXS9_THEON|nr:hypothetical protein [Thermococcus onnurineus]ACJ16892.1 hypothetical protein TON_1402 [Thermococcus onnurineus NA1]